MLSGSLFSQDLTGLISEEISEYQDYTAGPGDWIPEGRQLYFYDAKGQRTFTQYKEWDQAIDDWKTVSETGFQYDRAGHLIREYKKTYSQYPDQLIQEAESRYHYFDWMNPNSFEQKGSYYRETDHENETEMIREQECEQDTIRHQSSCR